MSLRAVIEGAGLSLSACAGTLGIDSELFQQWADSHREMPPTYARSLAAILGVSTEEVTARISANSRRASKVEPSAIWFKFRGTEFSDLDRESILMVRRLGHNANQLERAVGGQINSSWSLLFQDILSNIDLQSSPQTQGRVAAQAFCGRTQFGQGGKGSSEILRGNLRSRGIVIIESPIPKSQIEGCSFLVGDAASQRPCIFVNSFNSTWFRRNTVIMHELAHSIFDRNSGVEIDVVSQASGASENRKDAFTEVRAESFARECLLPKSLILSFCSQNGLRVTKLDANSLAALVAFSGVEKKTIVAILRDNEMIDDALSAQYISFDISQELRDKTDHALSTREYISKVGLSVATQWLNKRFTNIAATKILLPVAYVNSVIDAVRSLKISMGKAAELLMIDSDTFSERFASLVEEVSE